MQIVILFYYPFPRTYSNIDIMNIAFQIPEPFQFNPLKHHLAYIREYTNHKISEEKQSDNNSLVKELRHIGTSVMDVYSGKLSIKRICRETTEFLNSEKLMERLAFSDWTGKRFNDFRIITLSDKSQWMLKYHNDESRYVHIFPSRLSPHTFRVKANTLKSAIHYYILIGKDYISRRDLNHARSLLSLSPIKDPSEAEAITEMIEILRV